MEDFVIIKVRRELRDELKILKREWKFRSLQALLRYLLMNAREKELAIISEKIFEDTRPAILTGESGAGKTTAMKKLLRKVNSSIFVIDVSNEYDFLKPISLSEFFAVDFTKNQQLRFVPSASQELCQAEVNLILRHLNFIKRDGKLKNTIIVLEEAHRFIQDPEFITFLVEARKFTKKFIVITTEYQPVKHIAPVYRPPPFEVK